MVSYARLMPAVRFGFGSDVVEMADNLLLVGVDETGHEEFPGGHSTFRLGGCADTQVTDDWGKVPALEVPHVLWSRNPAGVREAED